MNEETVQILQTTFADFARDREKSAALFYERLFALDPSLRRLFSDVEMGDQQTKLMAALGLAINSLRNLKSVVPLLEDLARRHVAYGVRDNHYATVGQALIQSLAISLGSRFTPEIRGAWLKAYETVSSVMISAAAEVKMTSAAE